jgi:hypothetical protein
VQSDVCKSGCICVPLFTTVLKNSGRTCLRTTLIGIRPRHVTDDCEGGEVAAAPATLMNTLLPVGLATPLK